MPAAEAALKELERAVKDLHLAWNTAEGRRGRISENRELLSKQQAELESQREALRQELWKVRKESTTLQHARDEAEALGGQLTEMTVERENVKKQLRGILSKLKAVSGELR